MFAGSERHVQMALQSSWSILRVPMTQECQIQKFYACLANGWSKCGSPTNLFESRLTRKMQKSNWPAFLVLIALQTTSRHTAICICLGDLPARKFVFVSTMWDEVGSEARTKERGAQLKEKMFATDVEPGCKHQSTWQHAKEAKKSNNPQTLASLEADKARIQSEINKTFEQVRELKIPLPRPITLFFGKKPKGVCPSLSVCLPSADSKSFREQSTLYGNPTSSHPNFG